MQKKVDDARLSLLYSRKEANMQRAMQRINKIVEQEKAVREVGVFFS